MSNEQRRVVAQAAWRLAVLALLSLVVGWDALGLLIGGDDAYRSPSFDVLRLAPGGMRFYGPMLGVLFVTTVFAYGRHSAGSGVRGYRLLRLCLSLTAGWYVFWAAGIVGSWWIHWQILAFGAVGKLAFIAAVSLILARGTPTNHMRG